MAVGADKAGPVEIWPSILAADLADLSGAARAVEAVADGLHVDMMDGRFVPNLTMGPPVLAALARRTPLRLEAHLMVQEPEALLDALAAAGARRVVVHAEATAHLERVLARVRALGMEAGVALNPATGPAALEWVAHVLDSVIVMTVNPGFGGQSAIPAAVAKVARVRAWAEAIGLSALPIGVDGGMDANTLPEAVRSGATQVIAGTSVFGAAAPARAVRDLRSLAEAVRADRQVPGQA